MKCCDGPVLLARFFFSSVFNSSTNAIFAQILSLVDNIYLTKCILFRHFFMCIQICFFISICVGCFYSSILLASSSSFSSSFLLVRSFLSYKRYLQRVHLNLYAKPLFYSAVASNNHRVFFYLCRCCFFRYPFFFQALNSCVYFVPSKMKAKTSHRIKSRTRNSTQYEKNSIEDAKQKTVAKTEPEHREIEIKCMRKCGAMRALTLTLMKNPER